MILSRLVAKGVGEVEKTFPNGLERIVRAMNVGICIVAGVGVIADAQTRSDEYLQLPSQARPVQGIVMPVPKEIFRTLDQFHSANWPAIKRPEIAIWKSRGERTQIASLLGITIAEGFIAMEAKDSAEVKSIGNSVLKLSRGLAVEERALRRSRSIMEHTERAEWGGARDEWDGVLADLENGMIEIKSMDLAQLISIAGWLRGTEALSELVLEDYSEQRSELIRQPALLDSLEKQILAMSPAIQSRPIVAQMLQGLRRIRALSIIDNAPITEAAVREIHGICSELVELSGRPSG